MASLALGGCGAGSARQIVARVGDASVTSATLARWVSIEADGKEPAAAPEALRQRMLAFLLGADWTRGDARRLGIAVSDAEARQALERLQFDRLQGIGYEPAIREGMLSGLLSDARVPTAARIWAMKLAVLRARIEDARIRIAQRLVTRAQIEAYYGAHLREFRLPDRRDVELVEAYKRAAIERAAREIRAGASFRAVAAHRSIYAVTPHGIRLNFRRSDAGLKALAEAIFAAKPGVLMGPKKIIIYYLFRVVRVKPAQEQSLARVAGSIRRRLGRSRAKLELARRSALQWGAGTSCSPGPLEQTCRASVRALLAGA